ncbi:polysaccharide deacetylase family protein [Paenibacillus sp. GSMTC-2017]|uniref:polysaccharide deacetylase family protein n=1 Tax=Paenibacillus sp. GSMTC-2017 TaxID=2794350 RepID=UPI0018D87783|nr:polysaccharide deacetylase family protein [Paenibacillus sp. GSMTC-2017]MBH5319670.1 polysaccharide deacetylase family protein [Paenibacillus sp. GSMTC-2017]
MNQLLKAIFCLTSFVLVTGFAAQPEKHDRKYYEERKEIVWEVPMDEKLIALTFDDGPNANTTPQILDLLKQYNAKATFFVIGNRLDKYAEVIKREAFEGHEVANHTYNHIFFTRRVGSSVISNEIIDTQKKITELTGQNTKWFRPPGGYYNDRVIDVARANGYTVILWSWHQDTQDWNTPGVDRIVNKVLKNARNGDIVLMHDHVNGSTQTVRALERILPALQEQGYRMVTISELMEHKTKVDNPFVPE